nr:immunoglobulin heavy chain junction region [Mus musculus]MBK4195754.1 immunoglobulin heavy chain junction region [Mus musculus]MBK4195755.1 immunoglobulin heavy chain junction region [Mus musculus]
CVRDRGAYYSNSFDYW